MLELLKRNWLWAANHSLNFASIGNIPQLEKGFLEPQSSLPMGSLSMELMSSHTLTGSALLRNIELDSSNNNHCYFLKNFSSLKWLRIIKLFRN